MRRLHKLGAVGAATLLLLVGGVGVALAAAGSRTYRGKTSQHQAFKLVRAGKSVKKIAFKWVGKCQPSGKKVAVPFKATGLAIKHGKFSDSAPFYTLTGQKGFLGIVQISKLTGKINKHKTTGSFSFQGALIQASIPIGVCTGSGTWHAKHRRH